MNRLSNWVECLSLARVKKKIKQIKLENSIPALLLEVIRIKKVRNTVHLFLSFATYWQEVWVGFS